MRLSIVKMDAFSRFQKNINLFLIFVGLFLIPSDSSKISCSKKHSLVGFIADLSMLQHQLRGTIEIIDDCSFNVSKFDMFAGENVFWWGSNSPSLDDMMNGFPISPNPLIGSYNTSTLTVRLSKHINWNNFSTLAVWANKTASNYGHVTLEFDDEQSNNDDNKNNNDYKDTFTPPSSPSSYYPSPFIDPSYSNSSSSSPFNSSTNSNLNTTVKSTKRGKSQPTMFDNCVELTQQFRVRWTVNHENLTVDFGLEGVVEYSSQYLGLGIAIDDGNETFMSKADITIVGFDSEDNPFAEDFFAISKEVCEKRNGDYVGVCPDSILADSAQANNVQLIWGQMVDGITLIRFQRPITSPDLSFDYPLDPSRNITFLWAIGRLQYSDTKSLFRLIPQFDGSTPGFTYGTFKVILQNAYNECHGPMYLEKGQSQNPSQLSRPVIVADRGSSFSLTTADSAHYPNPPTPGKSVYVDGHESPILKVERGVLVQFSVECGHDVPIYITSDPIGGNLNSNESIYAGGEFAHGVPAVPYVLTWMPNSSTPDYLYYQAYSKPKMGWLIHVVDGGLSDMYTFNAPLADGKVTLFWTLTASQISFAVRSEVPCEYLALGFGSGMVNSFAYVGYIDNGSMNVSSYYINGKSAKNIHTYNENISSVKCVSEDKKITFEFTKLLNPNNCGKICNVIDSSLISKFVWAMGTSWSPFDISETNMHFDMSSSSTIVNLENGRYEIEKLESAFSVHGFMMFISWAILFPFGIFSARYMRQFDWFKIHVYTQVAGISVMILGLLFAVGELRGFNFSTFHSKIGIISIALALFQPLNSYFRPKKNHLSSSSSSSFSPSPSPSLPPEDYHRNQRLKRMLWLWIHILTGRSVLCLGFASMCTGFITFSRNYSPEITTLQIIASLSVGWFAILGAWFGYNEYHHVKKKRLKNDDPLTPLAFSEFMNQKTQNGHAAIVTLNDDDDDGDDYDKNGNKNKVDYHHQHHHDHDHDLHDDFDDMEEEKAIVQDLLPVSRGSAYYDSPPQNNQTIKEIELESIR